LVVATRTIDQGCRLIDSQGGGTKALIEKHTVVVVVVALLILMIRGDFFSSSPWVIAGQVAGVILVLWSRATFGRQQFRTTTEPGTGPLIQRGPYRFLRHPVYAGAMLLIWASILGHWSLVNAAIGIAALAFTLWRMGIEERRLHEHYVEYADYARRTKRIIPFVY